MQTRFRRAVISRDDAPRAQPPQSARLADLAFYGDLSSDAEIDLDTSCEQDFINAAGHRYSVAQPLLKAALMALSNAYPAALRYADLVSRAAEWMNHFEARGSRDETEFRVALFNLVMVQGVMPVRESKPDAGFHEGVLQANALARLQATTPGCVVSGAWQLGIGLDVEGRALLALLDGTRTVDQLTHAMQAMLKTDHPQLNLETIEQLIQQQLALFARQGLLQTASSHP